MASLIQGIPGLFLSLLLLMGATPSQTPEQLKQWQQERESKLSEVREVEQKRDAVAQEEQGVLQRLQQIEMEWIANQRALAEYEKAIEAHRRKADKLQDELKTLQTDHAKYRSLVSQRIRAIYKAGYSATTAHALQVLLTAQNTVDFLHKYKYVSAIADADRDMLRRLESQQAAIQKTSVTLIDEIRSIESASQQAAQKQQHILEQKRERERLLHQYRTEKQTYERTLKELKSAVAVLEQLLGIVSEESVPQSITLRPEMKGKLGLPVAGKMVPNQTTADRGLTIQAKRGTPVRCVADGTVARTVESIVGFGNTVLVSHGDGYISVYAHLSEILVAVGDTVHANQTLGKVGDTGSLIGDVLYFELWHNYSRLNTREWLAK